MNTPVCSMTSLLRHPGQGLVSYETSAAPWHLPSHPTVVKTEPLSLEERHSPVNDSGISQDHGSSSSGPSPPTHAPPRPPFTSSPHSPGFQPDPHYQAMVVDRVSPNLNGIIRINSPNMLMMPGHYAPRGTHFSPPLTPHNSPVGSDVPRRPSPLAALPVNPTAGDDNSSASSASDGDGYYPDKMAADGGYYPDKMAAEHGQEGALKSLQAALERSGTLCPEQGDLDGPEKMQCPLCTFASTSRAQFHGHLGTHYEHKCTLCDFTAQGVDALRAHMRDEHDQLLSPDTEPDTGDNENDGSLDGDEPGVRIPRVNSQGKVKTFRCKQCDFVSVTKLVFWEHSRSHIKLEKLLTCPKCPFVTEYKHHLEYHLRNHFGSKPFKCDKCSYSCVNKSMLNSHLKSHSNVYQYRCADCNYATKYCHSLKLHLRKYTHKPAMVLNPDGSPNPLPIIDVYGTRRGPKLKPKDDDVAPPTMIPGQFAMYQNPFMVPSPPVPFPYGPLMSAFPHNPPFPAFPHHQAQEKGPEKASMERIMSFVNNNNMPAPTEGLKEYMSKVVSEESILDVVGGVDEEKGTPLDLSRAEPEVATVVPPVCVKSRRKGKAFKLERIAMKLQHRPHEDDADAEEDADEGFPPKKAARVEETPVETLPKEEEVYNCQFCDIAFRDIVMYTMHMGYHGFQDPFKCNMCGQQTTDKVSFFLHIARTSHC